MNKIGFLHIADLHMNRKQLIDIERIRDALITDIKKIELEYCVKPQFVFFTGDLINKGENSVEELALAKENFIQPLLSKLNLNENNFFIIPGNHEINRKKTSENLEYGLQSKILDNESFIEYYRAFESNDIESNYFKNKLSDFFEFKNELGNSNMIYTNFFYDVYKIDFHGFIIGIVGFNTAWLSSQFGEDEGRLILGEEIVIEASEKIKDCNLKIALQHHPFDMFVKWDKEKVINELSKNFDLLFNAHIHNSNFEFLNEILGSLYVHTCGSIHSGRITNGYSILDLDIDNKKSRLFLRKWYSNRRKEFDQETSKCEKGIVFKENITFNNKRTNKLVAINNIRNEVINSIDKNVIVYPFDVIKELELRDVFVEPIISDKSHFDQDSGERKFYSLIDLIKKEENQIFFGRKEFGKTTLLKQIQDIILTEALLLEGKIPVFIEFSDLPKNNYKSLKIIIRKMLNKICTEEQIKQYLDDGDFIILIDDYNNPKDDSRIKRKAIFNDIIENYSNCRYIISMNENFTQSFNQETQIVSDEVIFSNYYLQSFNTTKIRNMLKKLSAYQEFNIDKMINQITYYFNKLQIPVTPKAITLLFGVLVNDSSAKNIKNEAYLIENYLQTILEKLDPSDASAELSFPDKETFLSDIAFRMVEKGKFEWNRIDFEQEKLNHFKFFDEDIPSEKLFNEFFKKGILQERNSKISFAQKSWFHFFLAKAMDKDSKRKEQILKRDDYLKYSTALSYKAGLSRNDHQLILEIDMKVRKFLDNFLDSEKKSINEYEIEKGLITYSEEIEKKIEAENTYENKDNLKDKKLLNYDSEFDSEEDSEEYTESNDISEIVALYSDIYRNTREISSDLKVKYLKGNIHAYLGLMLQTLDVFSNIVEEIPEDELKNFLFITNKENTKQIEKKQIINKIKEVIFQIIPVSIMIFSSDHLSHPKIVNSVQRILNEEDNHTCKLFYSIILLNSEFTLGIKEIAKLIDESKTFIFDQIILLYLIYFRHNEKLSKTKVIDLIALMEKIREKHPTERKKLPPFVRDTFASDMKKIKKKK